MAFLSFEGGTFDAARACSLARPSSSASESSTRRCGRAVTVFSVKT